MTKSYVKNIFRTVKGNLGRYIALIIIAALGVLFYVGLKVTTMDMLKTADNYYEEHNFYDVMFVSQYCFRNTDVKTVASFDGVKAAEGSMYIDAVVSEDDKEKTVRIHSLTETINTPELIAGRLPEKAYECVADSRYYKESDIGKTVRLSDENSDDTKRLLSSNKFTITGIVSSPLYLSYQRGTTSVGSGEISSFFFVDSKAFAHKIFSVIYVDLQDGMEIYSDEYNGFIEEETAKLEESKNILGPGFYADIYNPEEDVYVLDRDYNAGYHTYYDNACIIDRLTYIFPLFFALVAALVCSTTMSRMIEDERSELGVFKAMGFKKSVLYVKYLFYSVSAAVIGSFAGFFIGSHLFPDTIWTAYTTMYDYTDKLVIIYDYKLLALGLIAAVLVMLLTTLFTCGRILAEKPAEMIRPEAPKPGKRVFLEYITPLWNRLSFLHKVTIRNCFRYKKRFFMMVLGVAGCMAILCTGFGIKDSISDVCDLQYEEIEGYDISAPMTEIPENLDDILDEYILITKDPVTILTEKDNKEIFLYVCDDTAALEDYIRLKDDNLIEAPADGECIISANLADFLDVKTGEKIGIEFENHESGNLKVTARYHNYVYNYVFVNSNTYKAITGRNPEPNTILGKAKDDAEAARRLSELEGISSVSRSASLRDYFDHMISKLNVIVYLVIICSAALAFTVMFNLDNINIYERVREIATLRVLGFYNKEAAAYVFRENFILTVIGALAGIPLGILMHRAVMNEIRIEVASFDIHINPSSFMLSAAVTIAFAVFVDLFMRRKITEINMSESLKSIE